MLCPTNILLGLSVSSTDEEIVKETSVIEVVCPTCKRMLELKNELQIQKKGIVNVRVFQQVSKLVKMIRK